MKNLAKVLVCLDPAVTSGTSSDETGIVVVAKTKCGHGLVLDDLSGVYTPQVWASKATLAYQEYGANAILAEVNQGGEMIEYTLKSINPNIVFKPVRAKSSKYDRAIPVASLYKQGKIYHTRPFPDLEEQMQNFHPQSSSSPDRMDALVWGFLELFFESKENTMHIGASYV